MLLGYLILAKSQIGQTGMEQKSPKRTHSDTFLGLWWFINNSSLAKRADFWHGTQ